MVHAELAPTNDAIYVAPAWNEHSLIESIPGSRFMPRDDHAPKRWKLPLSWASMVIMRGVFQQHLTYDQALSDWVWKERNTRVDPALALRDVIEAPEDPADPLSKNMYAFQRADVNFMRVARSGLLGNAAGSGKTISLLSLIRSYELDVVGPYGDLDLTALPALIVCPNSVKHHWRTRVFTWAPANPYVIEKGTVAGRRIIAEAKEDPSAIVIINYESVRLFSRLAPYGSIKLKRCLTCDPRHGEEMTSSRCHVHPKELNDFPFSTIIIDEAHRIGDPSSQQTRAIWAISHGDSIKYRWAATGTPDNVERLWPIMHAVAPDEYPVKTKWLERYANFVWNYQGGMDVVGMRLDTRDEAYRVLDPRFRRMIKSVVLPQLPPRTREVRYAELPTAQRKMYDELDTQLHTRLSDGSLFITQNRLVSRTRQMQFASASVSVDKPDEDDVSTWRVTMQEPSAKLDVFEEVLDEMGRRPFVVAGVNRDLVSMAAERLAQRGIRHAIIMGGTSPQEQQTYTEDLKSGQLEALVFTIDAGGEGLDMSGADTLIFLQRSWSLIKDIQTEERVLRIGSEIHQSIRVIDLVTRNTVEEKQIEKLHEKLEMLDEITRDRAQVASRLRELQPSDEEFMALVGRMATLTATYEQVTANDDLDTED
jgi:SNF2 family DNA or RNA helicase